MRRLASALWLGIGFGSISACQQPAPSPTPALEQQVYIWQRQWTAQHAIALQESQHSFSQLRVLAAQAHPQEGWISANVDLQQLQKAQRPIIAVVRLDGQLSSLNTPQLLQQIQQLVQHWQQQPMQLVGLEIDYDSGTTKLPAYVDFLRALRQQLPQSLSLSMTVLPAWLDAPALAELRAITDHSVLQVHAVNRIAQGLFDPKQAATWIERYQQQAQRPFYVALPAYGAAVTASGAIESEVSLPEAGARQEYTVDPRAVAALMQQIKRQRPAQLKGWVWFRLPLPNDQRAWAWSTLQKVMTEQPLQAQLQLRANPTTAGLYDLTLVNFGDLPAVLPASIDLQAQACSVADIRPTYQLNLQANRVHLQLNPQLPNKTLAAGKRQILGWIRCDQLHSSSIFNDASPL